MSLHLETPGHTSQGNQSHRAAVRIRNRLGLHLRPASKLVKLASSFADCEITLQKEDQQVNAKSVMGVIMLAAEQGSEVIIEISGPAASDALAQIIQLIEDGFGEE